MNTVTPYYVHTDNLGSTNAVSDGTGTLVQTLDYFPYGAQRINSGTYTSSRSFLGQKYDPDTSLNYLNARYMKSSVGQFLSEDPVFTGDPKSQNLQDPQSLNSYSYSDDNPITKSDPNGKQLVPAIGVVLTVYGLIDTGIHLYDTYNTVLKYPQQFTLEDKVNSVGNLAIDAGTFGLSSTFKPAEEGGRVLFDAATTSMGIVSDYLKDMNSTKNVDTGITTISTNLNSSSQNKQNISSTFNLGSDNNVINNPMSLLIQQTTQNLNSIVLKKNTNSSNNKN